MLYVILVGDDRGQTVAGNLGHSSTQIFSIVAVLCGCRCATWTFSSRYGFSVELKSGGPSNASYGASP